ncbi:MAG: hypothetical protein JXR96_03635 [Deltaproteobacteria bacterium]|nr:hypothetical protein [Deltaproteobacteria bacterium]
MRSLFVTCLAGLLFLAACSDSTSSDCETDAELCARLGAECGQLEAEDDCGQLRSADCGACTPPETCGGAGTPNVCGQPGCEPESDAELCARRGAECGQLEADDNCGQPRGADCGTCTAPETCGGAGTPNVCGQPGCEPESDAELCARLRADCGQLEAEDDCGQPRTVDCGDCTPPETCGGGGIGHVCGYQVCNADGWCWENPKPQGGQIRAISAAAADEVWAVGEAGLSLRFDGQRWLFEDSGTEVRLEDVWAPQPGEAWAVGWESTVLRWDGTGWAAIDTGAESQILEAVSGSGPGDVWILGVGLGGSTYLHFDGQGWSSGQLADELRDIHAPAPGEVWGVGWSSVQRFAGSGWSALDPGIEGLGGLASVWEAAPGAVYLVGDYASAFDQSTVLLYDGSEFALQTVDCGAGLNAVWASGPGDVWAVGYGRSIVHFDGSAWQSFEIVPGGHLYAVGGVAGDVWMAGAGGRMYRSRGQGIEAGSIVTLNSVQDIWGTSATDLWAASSDGIFHRTQAGWSQSLRFTGVLYAIWGLGPSAVWAGGGGRIFAFDGRDWFLTELEGSITVMDIWGSGPDDVWAVGHGDIHPGIAHFDGSSWQQVSVDAWSHLNAVWGSAADDVWAAGGILMHYDGQEWSEVEGPDGGTFTGLWGTGPDDVWLCGDRGGLWRYDGVSWSAVPIDSSGTLRGLDGTGPDDVWIVEQTGRIWRFDGQDMQVTRAPGAPELLAICALPDEVWVCGSWGALLHLAR